MVEPYRITPNATINICPIDDNTNRVFNAFRRSKRDPTHDSVLITNRNINPKLRVATSDATARNAGVRLGGLYRTPAGVVQIRRV